MVLRNSDGVAVERTGYRDDSLSSHIQEWGDGFISNDITKKDLADSISARHREWGYDCPATNIDCLFVEYNHCQPVAILDFKGKSPSVRDRGTANARTIANLANRGKPLPFYNVYYDNHLWTFILDPINDKARELMPKNAVDLTTMSEESFVRFLYDLRDEVVPSSIVKKLQTAD